MRFKSTTFSLGLYGATPLGKRLVFEALGLPDDLSPDDLSNLLPCRALRNEQKSDWVFVESSARFFRQLAEEKIPAVKRWIAELTQQENQDRIRSSAEAACNANPSLKKNLIEALAAVDPYPAKDYFSASEVRLSRPCVRLHCFLPDRDGYGSLIININTLYLYRVLITLDGNNILQSLLGGWGTDPVLRQRGFVVGPRVDQPDEWLVRFAGATVFLTTEELYQLCEVVDMLAPRFLQALVDREIAQGTLAFATDGPRNVRLLKIKRRLWEEILRFAREHDYQNGSSPWHVFDASGHSHIKTMRRTPEGRLVPSNAHIYPTITEHSYGSMIHAGDDVLLCWEANLSRLQCGEDSSSADQTAADMFQWLADKLIPEVVRGLSSTSLFDRFCRPVGLKQPPRYFCKTSGLNNIIFEPIRDWATLAVIVGEAQRHYNSHPHEPVQRGIVDSAFGGLKLIASNVPSNTQNLRYYAGNLGVLASNDFRQMVARAQVNSVDCVSFAGFYLDLVLRCIVGVLNDHFLALHEQQDLLQSIDVALTRFIESFRWEAIRHRTLARIKQYAS